MVAPPPPFPNQIRPVGSTNVHRNAARRPIAGADYHIVDRRHGRHVLVLRIVRKHRTFGDCCENRDLR